MRFEPLRKESDTGCLTVAPILIGIVVIMYVLGSSNGDFSDHLFELILIAFLITTSVIGLFRKKGDQLLNSIEIDDRKFKVKDSLSISLEKLRVAVFYKNEDVASYCVWNTDLDFMIYSYSPDELIDNLLAMDQIKCYQYPGLDEIGKIATEMLAMTYQKSSIAINFETGTTSIVGVIENEERVEFTPKVFMVTPKLERRE